MKKCPKCGGARFADAIHTDAITVDGRKFTAALPARRCGECGEVYIDGPAIGRFELAVAAALVGAGASSGISFKFMRKSVGLKNTELAELLDVNVATLSRWETGKKPVPRADLATLGSIVLERHQGSSATLERLRVLKKPPRAPRRAVRLDLRADSSAVRRP